MDQFAPPPIGYYPPPMPPPVPVPPPLPAQVDFTGDRNAFLQLVARGAGLELVTLGFYRFWLVTDIRRHLWSNTVIDGDAAEYTGRGRELLIGFLIRARDPGADLSRLFPDQRRGRAAAGVRQHSPGGRPSTYSGNSRSIARGATG